MVMTGIAKLIKLCKNLIKPNLGVMMAKAPAKKVVKKETAKPDYFKLPFEVYYSDHVPITMMEFKSDIKVKKFEDIKIVHREQGGSWGVSFRCGVNKGPELFCCIHNYHDEVAPEWFEFLDEENVKINAGDNFAVQVENGEIIFRDLSDEEQDEESESYLDLYSMDPCCSWTFMVYEISESSPDYLILDSDNSRLKVSLDGFVLDDDENLTDVRIFNPAELDDDEFEDYSRQEMWDAKFEWVKSTLEKDFPKQKNKLRLAY